MSKGIPTPPEVRAAIIADVRRGDSRWDVRDRYQVGRSTVDMIVAAAERGVLESCGRTILTGEQRAEITSRYEAGEKAVDLAPEFRVSEDAIRDVARKAGVLRGPARVQLPLRHNAFDILTPDAAYWLGVMFTDGTINRRRDGQPEIALALQGRDREHLVKLRRFLGSDHAITPITTVSGFGGAGHFRYSVRSRPLADRLDALGRYGPCVDPELAVSRDFWRGAIDGDGCLSVSCGLPGLKLFGTSWLLQAFVDFIGPPGHRGRPVTVRPSHSIFVVGIGGGRAVRITERLYSDAAVALDRKAATAAKIAAMEPPFIWPCNR